jgi:hypothetical protein
MKVDINNKQLRRTNYLAPGRKHIKWAGMGGPLLPRSPSLPSLYAPVKIHKQPSVFIELSTV